MAIFLVLGCCLSIFSSSSSSKDISYLPNGERKDVAIFEGAFDFLSTLVHYGCERSKTNVLVLNSAGMVERAIDRMETERIEKVHAYLDHDRAGETALDRLRGADVAVQDASGFYNG